MVSPPVYAAYPQPQSHPSFRHRRSSGLSAVDVSSDEVPEAGPSSVPSSSKPTSAASTPERAPRSGGASIPSSYGSTIHSNTTYAEHYQNRKSSASTSRSLTPDVLGTPALYPHPGRPSIPAHLREWKARESISRRSSMDSSISLAEEGEATPLLGNGASDALEAEVVSWYRGPIFVAGVKLALLFLVFTAVVVGTFHYVMPAIEPEDRPVLKLPRSFADLQALNSLFEKYKREYPYRLLICGAVSYLFVQTFSLPGSMYIAILFGAAYGLLWGLFLSCLCDSLGSVLCYIVSSLLAPPLLTLPFYRARVEAWRIKIMGDPSSGKHVSTTDIFAFLLVLRISPFPPHWVCNVVAPHVGIGVGLFWIAAFIGIIPISLIHVTIGSSLDDMTSAADFHILSARNVFGLVGVVVGVLIPVGLKRVFKKDLGDLGATEQVLEEQSVLEDEVRVPPIEALAGYDAGHAEGRRYQAVDAGVVLAAPSEGAGDIHPETDASARKGTVIKGRPGGSDSRILDRGQADDEVSDASGFEIFTPADPAPVIGGLPGSEKATKAGRDVKNYGAIESGVERTAQIRGA